MAQAIAMINYKSQVNESLVKVKQKINKSHLDDKLPLKNNYRHHVVIIIKSAFYDNSKCYPQVFLGECL